MCLPGVKYRKGIPKIEIEEGNMFLWQHSIPKQRRIKTLFQYNLTSQKMLLGRRAELSYDAPVKFCIGEVLWAMPKRNGVFFGMPYLIGLSWHYVKFGHCQNSASCCIVSFACWDLFHDRGALNLPSDTVNSPICGTRPIPLYKQQCKHISSLTK